MWVVPPAEAFAEVRRHGRTPGEGLLGLSNVLREVAPLFVMCDPLDIGTTVNSRSTDSPAVYIYDKYPGGLWVDHLDEGGCSGPFKVKSYGNGQQLALVT